MRVGLEQVAVGQRDVRPRVPGADGADRGALRLGLGHERDDLLGRRRVRDPRAGGSDWSREWLRQVSARRHDDEHRVDAPLGQRGDGLRRVHAERGRHDRAVEHVQAGVAADATGVVDHAAGGVVAHRAAAERVDGHEPPERPAVERVERRRLGGRRRARGRCARGRRTAARCRPCSSGCRTCAGAASAACGPSAASRPNIRKISASRLGVSGDDGSSSFSSCGRITWSVQPSTDQQVRAGASATGASCGSR